MLFLEFERNSPEQREEINVTENYDREEVFLKKNNVLHFSFFRLRVTKL
jgi:hypothetical protein